MCLPRDLVTERSSCSHALVVGTHCNGTRKVVTGGAHDRNVAVAQRAREVHGETVVWITPDEVATIVANLEVFKPIVAIKRLFPGAEMLDVHPGEQPEKGAVSNEVRGL